MTAFNALTNGVSTLTIDRPPRVLNRFADRGRRGVVHESLAGNRIKIEVDIAPDNSKLHLEFTKLTLAQAETLATLADAGGVVTAKLYSGDGDFSVVFGEKDDLEFEAIVGDHPDADRSGSALPSTITYYRAKVVLYKV